MTEAHTGGAALAAVNENFLTGLAGPLQESQSRNPGTGGAALAAVNENFLTGLAGPLQESLFKNP